MITAQNGIYKLDTDNTSYIFRECESGHLQHLYYGRKIHADAQVLCEKHVSIPGNTNIYSPDFNNFSLEDMCLEMSSWGKGDIREPFIEVSHADGSSTSDFLFESSKITLGKEESETLPGSYDEDGNVVSGSSDGSSDYEYDEYGNVIDTDNTVDYNSEASSSDSSADSSSDSSSASSSSGSGSSVVSYATQFVGNPYVWGGTSLTGGADCSGFTQSVYAQFGYSLPRTSYEQQNAGYEVSYADAQPGDLICYGGHVAIYMGNGQIVHASNARDGIKVSDNAAYRTITSVRRLV